MTLAEKRELFYKRLKEVNQFFKDYDVVHGDDVDHVVKEVVYEELGEDILSLKTDYKPFEKDEYMRLYK